MDVKKMEYAVRYLQERVKREFAFPFQVSIENDTIKFRLGANGKECLVIFRQPRAFIDEITCGDEERREAQIKILYDILLGAVKAEKSVSLRENGHYEMMKKKLILRPLNYEQVREEIQDVPHYRIGEIALVLYMVMTHVGSDYFTAKIRRSDILNWGVDEETLLKNALINTANLYPATLLSVEELLKLGTTELTKDFEEAVSGKLYGRGHVLTNTLQMNGAVAVFYPDVAKKLAKALNGNFLLAFTSIHEVQIHPEGAISEEVIQKSLMDTNYCCNQSEEILANRVYRYNAALNCFEQYVGGRFVEVPILPNRTVRFIKTG